jgi:hypothetical protein
MLRPFCTSQRQAELCRASPGPAEVRNPF